MILKLLCVLALSATATAQSRCTATLQMGSRGDCVRYLQRVVGTTADGIFGRNTRQAVINFQQSRGLVADGIVGRNTWAAIYGGAAVNNGGRYGNGGGGGGSNNCGCSYDNSGTTCSGGPTQGARNLARYLANRDSGTRQEIYNCRNIAGSNTKSLHAEGRAVDHYVTGSRGTATFHHLVSIACQNGIQEVIFNRRIWTQGRGERDYNGVSPHTDHVHVGLNRCGAQNFNL